MSTQDVAGVYYGKELGKYGFSQGHPFSPLRLEAFWVAVQQQQLHQQARVLTPRMALQQEIERFHTPTYVERVKQHSLSGAGFIDEGDTPAYTGIYEDAAYVVGSTLDAIEKIMHQDIRRAFVPIAGLHHAQKNRAAGFCVFNDCGVGIETLRQQYGIKRIIYVDIDAHHGDGVFYAYEADPDLGIVDIHEDGRFLYPGTGHRDETGSGMATGTKINIVAPPGGDDKFFMDIWPQAETFIRQFKPEFILLQCGVDSIAEDPLTHLRYSPKIHGFVTHSLCRLAEQFSQGRILALGGGGYNLENIAAGWTAVLKAMIETPFRATPR